VLEDGDDAPPCGCLSGKRQVFVYVCDRHAAFANAAGDAFDGTVAYVAGAEDTGYAGLKREGLTVKWPSSYVTASADIAIGVALE
jgi:hypothetical protein